MLQYQCSNIEPSVVGRVRCPRNSVKSKYGGGGIFGVHSIIVNGWMSDLLSGAMVKWLYSIGSKSMGRWST